ncbi:L-ascorbate metabolism protein UlaG (beta-lactamase superfamily) [Nocardiopsis mwathae]|uniref:L-ascorbate metabolism protein UlaG (Beta-lactamase superfamily) n=1 Tax=Nocardiopsis mwathae TaxID=1472723 RepID=A0A7W9YFY4_9ACTN|nr:MBL fold metallo-hydrolase [Nocardiopsis mwathae]MBB6171359.1 L-ascorbate metabolism protein UlaG (beta-lactamase superfamily) [Nocardiopsis mwathae]
MTKLGHACVRLERDGGTLVIDPGGFSEPDAAVGADAIAITHEHPDHFDLERLRAALRGRPGVEIYTHAGIAEQLEPLRELGARVHTVAHGDTARMAGFDVHVYGERHAVIHPDIPVITNIGFRIDTSGGGVFHPGDALTVPEDPVDTLLVPVQAPWSKVGEVIDYLREAAPRRALAIHDGLLSEDGAGVYARVLGMTVPGVDYARMLPGQQDDL